MLRLATLCLIILMHSLVHSPSASAQIAIQPKTISVPDADKGKVGEVYGNIRFKIEEFKVAAQEYWLKGLLGKLFGVGNEGEFVMTLEVRDPSKVGDEQLIARRVVAHFVKKGERFLIFDRSVSELHRIVFSGDLVPRLKVENNRNKYTIALYVYRSNSFELKGTGLLDTAIDMFNGASAALSFEPISAATIALYKQMKAFGAQVFKAFNDESRLVVAEVAMSFVKANQSPDPDVIEFRFPYDFNEPVSNSNSIWLRISFETKASELGDFEDGKFVNDPKWLTIMTQARVGDKGLLVFLAERESVKDFVKSMAERRPIADASAVVAGCDNVVNEIKGYFTTADTMGAYWAFLNQFWDTIVRSGGQNCLNKYESFLTAYGLPKPTAVEIVAALEAAEVETRPAKRTDRAEALMLQGISSEPAGR